MMDLKKIFKNHFNTKNISDDNLRKFAEIHLQRLSANNGTSQFTSMITATTTAYQDYFGAMTNEDTKFAVQQGLTIAMNNIVETFKKQVSQKEGIVRGTFGKESPAYQEFFPLGVNEYTKATLANIEMLMNRIITAASNYGGTISADFIQEFITLRDTYKAAREAQLVKIGEVADQRTTTKVKRDVIENQLMKNVHLIAAMFIGDVDRCMDFFDQSFLRDEKEEEEEPTPPEN